MADALTASLMGGKEADVNPLLLQATPDIQLGQQMQQAGLSAAPAYPAQALARLAQTLAGGVVQHSAISNLGKLYSNSAEDAATQLEKTDPKNPILPFLRSPNLATKMTGLQALNKSLVALGSPGDVGANSARVTGVGASGLPSTDMGKAARDAANARANGNEAAARAIEAEASGKTYNEQGVPRPRTPLGPAGGVPQGPPRVVPAPPVGSTPPIQPRPPVPPQAAGGGVPLAQPPRIAPPQAGGGPVQPPPQAGPSVPLNEVAQANGPALAQAKQTFAQQIIANKAAQEQASTAAQETTKGITDEKATGAYNSAKALQGRLDIIDHNIDVLGPKWMGAGAEGKAEAGKTWNSMLDTMGIQGGHVDPNKIATYEDFTKETKRAGMELIKSNFGGSREAASIIQMGASAVPAVQNTYLGAKYVSSTIRAAAQREIDLHEYKTNLLQQGQSLVGADVEFNRQHPPDQYAYKAITDQIPPAAKAMLVKNFGGQRDSKGMEEVKTFDKQFGTGTAEHILNITVHPRPAGQ